MDTKQKKILVFFPLPELKAVKKKLEDKSLSIELAEYSDVSMKLSGTNSQICYKSSDLKTFDYVWLLTKWAVTDVVFAVSLYLKYNSIRHTTTNCIQSKLSDIVTLSLNKISIPLTYFFYPNDVLCNKIKLLETDLHYPFIMKVIRGSLGNGVYLVKNVAEFSSLTSKFNDEHKYVMQKYIPNNFDYRIIVGNNRVLSGEKRIRQNDEFRNNAYLGAKEVFLKISEIPIQVQELALKATKALDANWAGLDIVTDKETGKSYVLEVNRRPGLTEGSSEITACEQFITDIKNSIE